MLGTCKNGLMVGLRVTWMFGKIVFPITLLVTILQHTPILPWIIDKIAPFMSLFGLSGDAAIPLVLGNVLNIYAAIGAILSLDFTVKEVFIIAVMLSFSHSMILESGVAIKTGVKLWVVLLVRIGLAVISGIVINLVWQGGTQQAQYGFVSAAQGNEAVSGWLQIGWAGLQAGVMGVLQLAMIVIPLMIGIQIMKDLKWLDVFSKWMSPFTRSLGMNPNTSTTLAAGLVFGLAYGAGVMIQAVKEDGVSKKDLTIAFIFLSACHAVIEDTLIFAPLGVPVLPLLLIRLLVAIVLTASVAIIWNKKSLAKTRSKEITYEQ